MASDPESILFSARGTGQSGRVLLTCTETPNCLPSVSLGFLLCKRRDNKTDFGSIFPSWLPTHFPLPFSFP